MPGKNGQKPGEKELEEQTLHLIEIRKLKDGRPMVRIIDKGAGSVLTFDAAMGMVEYARTRFRMQAEGFIAQDLAAKAQAQGGSKLIVPNMRPGGPIRES